jgi:hypothetical protein
MLTVLGALFLIGALGGGAVALVWGGFYVLQALWLFLKVLGLWLGLFARLAREAYFRSRAARSRSASDSAC